MMHIGFQTERRPLPIGIQTFSTLREEGCYYVDKTSLIRDMIRQGRSYLLSRPRRFGKSLLVSTLKELFEGNEPLFRGLDIHPHWDWSVKYPVVRLSFGGNVSSPEDLEDNALSQLFAVERAFDLNPPPIKSAPERLRHILHQLHQATGRQVVVLVDEYDRPVLNVLEDRERARANRNSLRDLYSILKDAEEHVRFVFVTGITMFSKTSFSSGLNNLDDISLYPPLATICGYTDHDLDAVFAPELEGLDREQIRTWYNGYSWLGGEKLYNPHDILHLFRKREFRAHWFQSGEPGYLYRLLAERRVSPLQLENCVVDADSVSKYELDSFSSEALLFQSGYLTIREKEGQDSDVLYRLCFPNFEVQSSFNRGLADHLTGRGREVAATGRGVVDALGKNDLEGFSRKFNALLSGIPHPWHDSGGLGGYESWYASLLYMCFRTTRIDLRAEETTSHGRSDMVLLHGGRVFVLEFKMAEDGTETEETLDSAIVQIRDKGYAEKYLDLGQPIHLIGMVFGGEKHSLLGIRSEGL
ncbi:MAG: AAA family ATPase [Gammaproteobacteria bacterium]|nr:AAA family ATPase [Gammaproteobacteria bacterium]